MKSRLSRLLEKLMQKRNVCNDDISTLSKTASHKVPGATISVSKAAATLGDSVVIKGEGFPGFSTISELTIGGVNAIPVPVPFTDVNGAISVAVLVPGLSEGTHVVVVTIGGVSANTSLNVAAGVPALPPKELARPVMDSGGFDWLDAPAEDVYSIEDGRAARWPDPL